jgi:hypothetical protein
MLETDAEQHVESTSSKMVWWNLSDLHKNGNNQSDYRKILWEDYHIS